jgi:predicted MFS family arabinose efflux permease
LNTRSLEAIRKEWAAGWTVVLSGAIGYGTGGAMLSFLLGLFIMPMHKDLGLPVSAVTIFPIIMLVWGLCSPFAGLLIDRIGSRRAAILGSIGLAICTASLWKLPISQFNLYAIAVIIGLFNPLTSVASYAKGVGGWFRHSIGTAFGLVMNGGSFVAIFAVPAIAKTIEIYGWRAGFLGIAIIIFCVGLPIITALFFEYSSNENSIGRHQTDEHRRTPLSGMAYQETLRSPRFWAFGLTFLIATISVGGFMAHLQPLLADKGFGLSEAIALGLVYVISVSAGRMAGGVLLDTCWDCAVACVLLVLAGVGGLALAGLGPNASMIVVTLAVAALGLGQGAEADFVAYFMLRRFGMLSFSANVATMTTATSFGSAIGGWLYAHLFDISGNYVIASYVGGIMYMLSGIMTLFIGICENLTVRRRDIYSGPR